nr:sulfite exporter TauE/SafE family protein [Pelomonas sp. P8]
MLGALAGVALGLTGAGGGILAIPLLTFGAGLSQTQAAPIALVAISLAATLGAMLGLRDGVVRYRAALLIGGAGMLVAPAGVWLAHRAPPAALTLSLAVVMALSALTMYRRSLEQPARTGAGRPALPVCYWSAKTGRFVWTRSCAAALTGIGLVAGAISGLLGVGGGFVLVPAFTRLSNLRVDAIVSTSQAVIALVSAAGALAAAGQQDMQWQVALPFTLAAMGALIGARLLARRLSPRLVQRSFALLSGGIATALLVRAAQGGLA